MARSRFEEMMASQQLPAAFRVLVEAAYRPIAARLAVRRGEMGRTLIVGLCGAQGTGKSTMASFLEWMLCEEHGLRTAVLSLDDLYYPREQRESLARKIHPLLRTRGVPGTHEVSLGLALLDALTEPAPRTSIPVPRFDKATDTRLPRGQWKPVATNADIVLLEGWCIGAESQTAEELASPINALERNHDPDGRWRSYVNECLGNEYRRLFARLDMLVMLKAPSFESVFHWRSLQEEKLRARVMTGPQANAANRIMSESELRFFLMHYERLTRHMLAHMPARADILLALNEAHGLSELMLPGERRSNTGD